MAGSFAPYAEAAILNHVFGGTTFTPPATIYAEACSVAPSDASAGTPISTLARLAVTNNATNFPAATGSSPASKTNGTALLFAAMTEAASIVGVNFYDAASNGNRIAWGTCTSTAFAIGDEPKIPAGGLTITLT